MGLGLGGSIRFVSNAAAPWRGFKRSSWMSDCSGVPPSPHVLLDTFVSVCPMYPSRLFGDEVKGRRLGRSRQEATSVVWRLTRMDCVSDARGAHPGCPGHAALASRSAGVRDAVRLSSSMDPGKPINIKRRLIIWEGNCGSIGPLILLGVAPLLISCQTRGHFLVYSPLSFCSSAPLGAPTFPFFAPSIWYLGQKKCCLLCAEERGSFAAAEMEQAEQRDSVINYRMHARSWVPADKHTSLNRIGCLQARWWSLWKHFEPKRRRFILHHNNQCAQNDFFRAWQGALHFCVWKKKRELLNALLVQPPLLVSVFLFSSVYPILVTEDISFCVQRNWEASLLQK